MHFAEFGQVKGHKRYMKIMDVCNKDSEVKAAKILQSVELEVCGIPQIPCIHRPSAQTSLET